ncbi:Uncharacterized protein conserved in bacteria [Delftia tsuruhatensis]|uniref:phage baseplate assembly protein V n=1 Tax=Delftia tsuruhatensis TaxID=180282 RepID=UPI001E74AB0E|nr:phage baseplate assembly protein V [Delftia tsuruhatensis]CAB5669491.1 Uncharacterized protein conserved in bacteria [Delftia tsuruhatensis]CAC9682814.1 Uncharacterized protein conserved in bacteria [Delftia tsuruhatensis]
MSPPTQDPAGDVPASLAPGVTLGAVSNTEDPKGLGRVRLRLKLKGREIETDWAQIASFMAGPDCGGFFLPQPGDTALVAFADGDPSQPYVVGFLWNGAQKPPVPQNQQQDIRVIRTRQGKTVRIDDSPQGGISIVDEKGNEVLIDSAGNRIAITSKGDLSITATGQLTMEAAGVTLKNTAGSVKAQLTAESMQLQGGMNMKLQASMIDLN